MDELGSFEFLVGIAVGKILFAALFAVPVFRMAALMLGAIAISFAYATEGVTGILAFAHVLQDAAFGRPDFAKGAGVGAMTSFILFGAWRYRNRY